MNHSSSDAAEKGELWKRDAASSAQRSVSLGTAGWWLSMKQNKSRVTRNQNGNTVRR
jgi:hypothetical protein